MAVTLRTVRTEAEILPSWLGTPIAELLRYQNLRVPARTHAGPEVLVALCFEQAAPLRLPPGFAITLHTGGANLKRVPFKVSWAIGIAGVSAVALVGHSGCAMVGLRDRRDLFIERLMATGWERSAAEQHFDHWSDLFAVDDPAACLAAEAHRLRIRYPRVPVAPLLLDEATGLLAQIDG